MKALRLLIPADGARRQFNGVSALDRVEGWLIERRLDEMQADCRARARGLAPGSRHGFTWM